MTKTWIRRRIKAVTSIASRVRKALKYKTAREEFQFKRTFIEPVLSSATARAAKAGNVTHPVIFLHGVAPRSGTNYLNALLDKHPKLHSCPGEIYEFPFLTHIDEFLGYQSSALDDYPRNKGVIVEDDILCQFGIGLARYIYTWTDEGKTPLVKEPSVRNLGYFHRLFPGHKLLLLIRDGRDVVQSTVSSWPGWTIKSAAIRWAKSARLMLDYNARYAQTGGCLLTRYEDLVENLQPEMERICGYLSIEADIYNADIDRSIPIIGSSTYSKNGGQVTWSAVKKTTDFKHKEKWGNWSNGTRAAFKKYAGQALLRAGYVDSEDW